MAVQHPQQHTEHKSPKNEPSIPLFSRVFPLIQTKVIGKQQAIIPQHVSSVISTTVFRTKQGGKNKAYKHVGISSKHPNLLYFHSPAPGC
jgi:hypothetical protein